MPNCPLTLRTIKGSKLTFTELDNNFLSLDGCIDSLQSNIYGNFLQLTGGTLTGPLTACTGIYTDELHSCSNMLTVFSDITINGDVVINGSATTINTQVIQSLDNSITLNYSGTHLTAIGGGIIVEDGQSDGVDSSILTDTNGNWVFTPGITSSTLSACTGIWTSNLYGCSPITVHDNIQSVGSTSNGLLSFSFGFNNIASGNYSHAEGNQTTASGSSSHAEGNTTTASGNYGSHAEGSNSKALGIASHAEGGQTTATGNYSHTEGRNTVGIGGDSHAEGQQTTAIGDQSHAEGTFTTAIGNQSHAEGSLTTAIGVYSHAEGFFNVASGQSSHAEGVFTTANGVGSHSSGYYSVTNGNYSHAEGYQTSATTQYSHTEGYQTNTLGTGSHAEGLLTTASGDYSHAEGDNTKAKGASSHAEGTNTTASGNYSHAEGQFTTASGNYSHAEGKSTTAIGNNSHTEGFGTVANGNHQHVQGLWNLTGNTTQGAFILGNGTSNSNRSNLIFAAGNQVNISGKTITTNFQMTSGATNGYVLSSIDNSGNAQWGNLSSLYTGNTSGDCISDLYVSNIHSCSPLNINPLDEGNVYFGSTSGVTIDLTNNRVGVNTSSPSETLDVNGKTKTINFQMTSGATDGYVLTSDVSGNASWEPLPVTSGRFGIADSGGTYTYYSTLSLAMSAATAGQTIEMFADVTETGAVTITLKNGVNINGNGHTYNYTNATGNCFIDNGVAVVCSILNLVVNRTSHSSGNVWTITSASSNIDFLGSKTYLTSSTTGYAASLNGTIINLWIKSTGVSISGTFGGILQNCYVETTGSGYGITQLFPNATDCIGISASGRGFYIYEDGTLIRCYGKSTSGYGIFAETSGTNILIYNCLSLSSSGVALYLRGCKVYNNIAVSSSNVAINCAFGNNQIFNTTARSSSSYAINGVAGDVINNSSAISDGSQSVLGISVRGSSIINNWDNASGHSYLTPSSSSEIANNFMSVTNASANCIYNSLAVSVKYANNSFKGATTPVNANITQGIINTQDNQGNILL